MAGKGWVSIYREMLDKPIWLESTPEQKTILITLLLMANHAPKKWEWKGEVYELQPGQFITSLDSIVKKAGKQISVKNVRTAIKRFEKMDFLANESTNKNRLITIANWGFYQGDEGRYGQAIGQADGKQPATNNNVNNVNKEYSALSKQALMVRFENLWKIYPVKKGKAAAKKAYQKAVKDGVSDEAILNGIKAYKREIKSKGISPGYIAHGSTWFNQRRWEDEYRTQDLPVAYEEEEIPFLN